jgi:hypothetical protein
MVLESKLFDRKLSTLEADMNRLGSEGWEMIAACGVHNQTFVFMRTMSVPKKARAKVETASA